jgi:hypothetical protein
LLSVKDYLLAILLLSTQACHLCELAQQVLQQAFSLPEVQVLAQQHELQIFLEDIIDNANWLELYGDKIPVLLDEDSNLSLHWPFDVNQVVHWLQKVAPSTGRKGA